VSDRIDTVRDRKTIQVARIDTEQDFRRQAIGDAGRVADRYGFAGASRCSSD
jgi:hypothetical protein